MHDPYGSRDLHELLENTLGISVLYDDPDSVFSTHYHLSSPPWITCYFLLIGVEEHDVLNKTEEEGLDKVYECSGLVVRPISGADAENKLTCLRVGLFSNLDMTRNHVARFGLWTDQNGNFKEQDGLKKIDFVLR